MTECHDDHAEPHQRCPATQPNDTIAEDHRHPYRPLRMVSARVAIMNDETAAWQRLMEQVTRDLETLWQRQYRDWDRLALHVLTQRDEISTMPDMCRWAVEFRLCRKRLRERSTLDAEERLERKRLMARIHAEKLILWRDVALVRWPRSRGTPGDWSNDYLRLMLMAQQTMRSLQLH